MTMAKKDKKSEGLKRNLRIENLENRQLLSAMSVVDADAAAFAPALLDQPTVDFGNDAVIAPEDVAAEATGTKSSAVAIGKKITFSTTDLTNGAADGYYTVLITTTKIAKDASTSSYQTVKYVKDVDNFVLSYTGTKSTSYKGDYKFDVLEGKLSKAGAIEAVKTEANIKATASVQLLDTPKLTLVKDVKDNPKTSDDETDKGNVTDDLFTFTSTQLETVAQTNLVIKGAFNGAKTVTTYTVKNGTVDNASKTVLWNGTEETDYVIAYDSAAKEFTISGLDPNKSQSIQISYKTADADADALSSFSNKLSVKTEKAALKAPTIAANLTAGAESSSITVVVTPNTDDGWKGGTYAFTMLYQSEDLVTDVAKLWWNGTDEDTIVASNATIDVITTVTGSTYVAYTGTGTEQLTKKNIQVWTWGEGESKKEIAADTAALAGAADGAVEKKSWSSVKKVSGKGTLPQVTKERVLLWWNGSDEKTIVATEVSNITSIKGYEGYTKYLKSETPDAYAVEQFKNDVPVWTWVDSTGTKEVAADTALLAGNADANAKLTSPSTVTGTIKNLKDDTNYKITVQSNATKDNLISADSNVVTLKTNAELISPTFKKTAITDKTVDFQITNYGAVATELGTTGSTITITQVKQGGTPETKVTKYFGEESGVPAGWYTTKTVSDTEQRDKLIIDTTGKVTLDGLDAATKYTYTISTSKTDAAGTSRAVTVTTEVSAWAAPTVVSFTQATGTLGWTASTAVEDKVPDYYQVTAKPTTENVPTFTVRVAKPESGTACSYTFKTTELKANVEYKFTVVALKNRYGSNSAESTAVTNTTKAADKAQAPVVTATVASKVATVTANVGKAYDDTDTTDWVFKVALTGTGTYTSTVLTGQTIMDTLTFTGTTNLIKAANNNAEKAITLTATGSDGATFTVKAYYTGSGFKFDFAGNDALNSFSGKLTMTYGVETTVGEKTSTKWVGSGYDTIEF